jgi:hypothetical protein
MNSIAKSVTPKQSYQFNLIAQHFPPHLYGWSDPSLNLTLQSLTFYGQQVKKRRLKAVQLQHEQRYFTQEYLHMAQCQNSLWDFKDTLQMHFDSHPILSAIFDAQLSYSSNDHQEIDGQVETIRQGLCASSAAEKAKPFEAITAAEIRNQKALFKRSMNKHGELTCILIDLCCPLPVIPQFNVVVYERICQQKSKYFLNNVKSNPDLKGKVVNIQWRILKPLSGIYSCQAILYIKDCQKFEINDLLVQWGTVWSDQLAVSNLMPQALMTTCLLNDQSMYNNWSNLLESIHQPLNLYRYQSKSIQFKWKSFIGNIS